MLRVQKKWEGFFVFGFADTYRRYLGGVINIPEEAVYVPHLWFGVFHEIGHEYTSQIDLVKNPALAKALSDSGLRYLEKAIQSLEVYSEIFASLTGFQGDFDSYIESTWRYLGRLPATETHAYLDSLFLRFLMAYVFALEQGVTRYIGIPEDLASVAKELQAKLARIVPAVSNISSQRMESICSQAADLRVPLDIIKELIAQETDLMPKQDYESKLTYSPSAVQKGAIFLRVTDPVSFLQEVTSGVQSLSFSGAIATVLSLWNYQIKRDGQPAT
jgi:hypothetical protein